MQTNIEQTSGSESSCKPSNLKIRIERDENAESPREEDNLGTFIYWHRRYKLGDEYYNPDAAPDLETHLRDLSAAILLPVYLYDHSGLRVKIGSFQGLLPGGHAEFDSGQVGFIYVTREQLRKEYSVQRLTKKVLAQAEAVLRGEIETLDQYLRGDVWGYVVEDEDGKHLDSCWGFYGHKYCEDEANTAAAHLETSSRSEACLI